LISERSWVDPRAPKKKMTFLDGGQYNSRSGYAKYK
jgi:hypothetical protein